MSKRVAALLALCLAAAGRSTPVRADFLPPATSDDERRAIATIFDVEHARRDPAGLDPFLLGAESSPVRRRAILALGRIGKRAGVEPRLRKLLANPGDDAELVLFAAGISEIASLAPDVIRYLDGRVVVDSAAGPAPGQPGRTDVRVAAIEALGRLGDARADGYLLPILADASEPTVAAVAAAEAAVALKSERSLEAAIALAERTDGALRPRAVAAAWRLAGARKKARSTKDAPWAGDVALAKRVAPIALRDADPEVRVFAHRALALLLPATLAANADDDADPVRAAFAGAADGDPRVVADVVGRFLSTHEGPNVVEALWTAGYDADALVRETVAGALAAKPSPKAKDLAIDLLANENDVRVRLALAVALAANGDLARASATIDAAQGSVNPATLGVARAKSLAAAMKTDLAAKAALLALGRDVTTAALVRETVLEAAGDLADAEAAAYGLERAKDPDPVVRASAISLVGDHGTDADVKALCALYDAGLGRADQDARGAIVEAVGKLVAKTGPASGTGPAAQSSTASASMAAEATALLASALDDPSAAVRLAAREAAKGVEALKARAAAEDARPNDWTGLPRPKTPVLGIESTAGGATLSELEVLRAADEIGKRNVVVRFETDAGTIVYSLDPTWAPVHAVNLVLAASAGVYDGTPWHRVVPAFVIQGGDPRGDGSGDAGYSLPDEISPLRFDRGALGMPKSTKDTGGCQVFVMHMAAPHLDGHYTVFGRVVEGLSTVDRIRVGDRIRKATVVEGWVAPAK